MSGRRLLTLVLVLAAVGLPAGVLQAICFGSSCDAGPGEGPRVPFCPLPADVRSLLVNGFREGRSPDVLGVAAHPVFTSLGQRPSAPWPGLEDPTAVPIVFAGAGVASGALVPEGTTLDRVAPTVAGIVGLERPFPEVRSGTPLPGVATGDAPALVLLVAWKGVGTAELQDDPSTWPFLASLLDSGAGTLRGSTGSLPLDPAATLTTIGTGGLPSQHGITGSYVRDEAGAVRAAFGDGAPVTVIATLADDLDESTGQRSDIALVATHESDRGLIGGEWYPQHDTDTVVLARGRDAVAASRTVLAADGRADGVPDLLGLVLDGGVRSMDARTRQIVRSAEASTGGSVLVVVAGTGSAERSELAVSDEDVVAAIEDAVPGEDPVVTAVVPGGVFLDQAVLTRARVTGQVVADALLGVTDGEGRRMMEDAFQGFAVSFARYC